MSWNSNSCSRKIEFAKFERVVLLKTFSMLTILFAIHANHFQNRVFATFNIILNTYCYQLTQFAKMSANGRWVQYFGRISRWTLLFCEVIFKKVIAGLSKHPVHSDFMSIYLVRNESHDIQADTDMVCLIQEYSGRHDNTPNFRNDHQ